MNVVVPNQQSVDRYGVTALFPSSLSDEAQILKNDPVLNEVVKHHPTWLTSLHCTQVPSHTTPEDLKRATSPSSTTQNAASPLATSIPGGQSANWSGYQNWYYDSSTYSRYASAGMTWYTPAAVSPPSANPEWVTVWPGIGTGGYSGDYLIQAGTDSNSGGGNPITGYSGIQAWFEVYPKENMQLINNLAVHASDEMLTTVSWNGSTATFTICNLSTNTCGSSSETIAASHVQAATAEWIVERPTYNGNFTQLSPFGTISIWHAGGSLYQSSTKTTTGFTEGASGNGTNYAQYLDMMNCALTTTLAHPTAIDTLGDFSVTWKNGGSVESC